MLKQFGPVSLEVVQKDGVAALKVAAEVAIGGGAAAGVAKFKSTNEIDLDENQVLDLLDLVVKGLLPKYAGMIDEAEALAKLGLQKISV